MYIQYYGRAYCPFPFLSYVKLIHETRKLKMAKLSVVVRIGSKSSPLLAKNRKSFDLPHRDKKDQEIG